MVLTWAVLLAVAAVSFFLGKFVAQKLFSPGYDYDTPQVFTSNGLTLTLTREFKVEDSIAYTSGFTSKDAAVFALKEPFSQAPGVESRRTTTGSRGLNMTSRMRRKGRNTTLGSLHTRQRTRSGTSSSSP